MAGVIQKGLKNVLQKNPHDVVFLSALRTPVTRAKKGGLRDAYDHELLAAVCLTITPCSVIIVLTIT
jgi:acetyl-CoA acyltransferase 1